METLSDILKYSFPLLGVFIGWLLTQFGERFKVLREDKRRIKKTIFYLLEVHHHLKLFAGEEHGIRRYVTLLRNKFPVFFPKSVTDDQIVEAALLVLKDVIKEKPLITDDDLKNLSINYAKSIDSLSEIDPILAFRLHGRQNIQLVLKEFAERMKASVSQMGSNPNDLSEIDKAIDKMGPHVIDELLGDLEEIILSFAKRTDRKIYRETKRRFGPTMSVQNLKQLVKLTEKMLREIPVANTQQNQ